MSAKDSTMNIMILLVSGQQILTGIFGHINNKATNLGDAVDVPRSAA